MCLCNSLKKLSISFRENDHIVMERAFFITFSDLSIDVAIEEGNHLRELTVRPGSDRTFSVMSKTPQYASMMETIQPYRDQLMQAKKQLQDALEGGTTSHPVPVTSSQAKDVLELKENLSRVRPL